MRVLTVTKLFGKLQCIFSLKPAPLPKLLFDPNEMYSILELSAMGPKEDREGPEEGLRKMYSVLELSALKTKCIERL